MNDITLAIIAGIAVLLLAALFVRIRRKKQRTACGSESQDNAQVYVGNLSYRVHERDLRECFEKYGAIVYLKVVKNRDTGRSKGFGFVTFETVEQAKNALAVHGEPLFGRNLVVRLAQSRPKRAE